MESPLAQFRQTYFEECAELLDALQSSLDGLSNGAGDDETLHAIFRAVHSIKGGAGAFGFTALVTFSHLFENVLDALRDRTLAATQDVIHLLMRASDALADIVAATREDAPLPDGFAADIMASLQAALDGQSATHGPDAVADKVALTAKADSTAGAPLCYRITFAPRTELLERGNEPLLLCRQLKRLGALNVEPDTSQLPRLDVMDPETAYLRWAFTLRTNAPEASIREVFEFVEDDCDLTIQCVAPAMMPVPTAEHAADPAPAAVADAGSKAAEAASQHGAPSQSIRVDVDKLDRLVNLVGEMVITQAMLTEESLLLPTDRFPGLLKGIEALAQSARELQDSVMAIRAQPVRSVFARMPRVVRDLASSLGKEARIVMTGETTEIDKTVIEQLNDPLTHMIRNALDHGIEMPDVRQAAGKPREGTIHLAAAQRSGRIIIAVSDDGQGIDRAKVLAKAQARGLVAAGVTPGDDEIDNLIFLPAFSTADKVSNISGRGVGMDVVKRNVHSLGGRIQVESRFGTGSRFTMSLPLTLAVLDGMIVSVGRQTYIIPLTAIIESLRPKPADIHRVVGRGDVLALRGQYVPLVYLHRCFAITDAIPNPCHGIVTIVQSEGTGRVGVVVDQLLGQQQVVVKSLEANYESVDGISGATILGNGRVALILDVARLHEPTAPIQPQHQAPTLMHAS